VGGGESEKSAMQVDKRHILTIQEQPLILKALNAVSTGVESSDGEACETIKRLAEFEKQGYRRLILDLRAIEEPLNGTPQEIRNVGASLVGEVLFVTCQVSTRELLRIKVLTRCHFFPRHPMSKFDALFSRAVAGIEIAVSRIARLTGRAKAKLDRLHAQ
jgi:hypothetical protein